MQTLLILRRIKIITLNFHTGQLAHFTHTGFQHHPGNVQMMHLQTGTGVVGKMNGYQRITVLIVRSEEHTSELQSRENLVCRLLLEKKITNLIQVYVNIKTHCELFQSYGQMY